MEKPPAHCFHCKRARATETGLICAHEDFDNKTRPEVPIKGRAGFCPMLTREEREAEVIRVFVGGKSIETVSTRMRISERIVEEVLRRYVEALEKRVAEFEKGGYS